MSGSQGTAESTQGIDGHRPQLRRYQGDPYVVSVPEAAELLGISKDLGYDLARRGELPGAFQLGRRWRVSLVKLRVAVHGAKHDGAEEAG
jgi:excisionase family DNA binding protein